MVQELILKGNPYERGLKHGQTFAEEIRSCISHFKHELEDQSVLSAINATKTFLDKKFPDINDEIRGISDGTQVPFEDIFLFNNRIIAKADKHENCSDVAVFDNDTVIVGMNKDRCYPLPEYEKYFVKKSYPEKGLAFITYGHVGRIWGHGMNEAGLCTAGTAAHPLHNENIIPSLGSYFLPPLILSTCKNVSEALNLIDQIELICDSGNFLLCDSSGQMVVAEIAPKKRFIRKPENNRIIASTFFSSGQIEHRNNPEHLEESLQRYKTIENVLTQQDNINLDVIKKVLHSHRKGGSVCRHPEMGESESTVLSWIALPKKQEFYFLEGFPCKHEYERYVLK